MTETKHNTGADSKIGSTVYFFDINRRVYRKSGPGRIYSSGPPIWREHWRAETIVGETSRSWITSHGNKIAKNRKNDDGFSWDTDWIDKLAFVEEHRYKISEKVRQLEYDTLRKVAELIGYESAPDTEQQ